MSDLTGKLGKFAMLGPLGFLISESLDNSGEQVQKAHADIEKLRQEAAKQAIIMEFEKHRAQVSQELAIATRIASAQEVEIEEFYDLSGKGAAGLNINAQTETVGLGVEIEGRRVTRRVYRFKGNSTDGSR